MKRLITASAAFSIALMLLWLAMLIQFGTMDRQFNNFDVFVFCSMTMILLFYTVFHAALVSTDRDRQIREAYSEHNQFIDSHNGRMRNTYKNQ